MHAYVHVCLISPAFVAWVITRILRLLASELCHPLHAKALECFNSILHVRFVLNLYIYILLSISTT